MVTKVKILENLHKITDQIVDGRILKAVYILLDKVIRPLENYTLNQAHLADLNIRGKRHKNGNTSSYNREEALPSSGCGL